MTDTRETAARIVAEFQAREDAHPACDLFVWLRQTFDTALRTARAEALEEAAKVADERRDHWRERSKQEVEHKMVCDIRANMADTIAARIRALASKDVQP